MSSVWEHRIILRRIVNQARSPARSPSGSDASHRRILTFEAENEQLIHFLKIFLSTTMPRKSIYFFICAFFHLSPATNDRVNFFIEEVRSLSELPMDRLIRIREIFFDDDGRDEKSMEIDDSNARSTALVLPMALPLKKMSNRKSISRYEEDWDDRGKDTKVSKISKIFQLTITALSFLAFGGYLITLIISAIQRSRTAAAASAGVIVFSDVQGLQNYNRPKRRAWLIDPMQSELDEDRIYRGMIMLSQCYADMQY